MRTTPLPARSSSTCVVAHERVLLRRRVGDLVDRALAVAHVQDLGALVVGAQIVDRIAIGGRVEVVAGVVLGLGT
jgi:hypothetical protein